MSDYGHMDFTKVLPLLCVICAVLGWGLIELVIWLIKLLF